MNDNATTVWSMPRRLRTPGSRREVPLACMLLAVTACASGTEGATATNAATTDAQTFSIVLQPSTIRVSPGGSGVSIGTIRSTAVPVVSYVIGTPNGVSYRATTAATSAAETTVKYIFIADASVAPGTYPLGVRVRQPGGVERETQLTLIVAVGP